MLYLFINSKRFYLTLYTTRLIVLKLLALVNYSCSYWQL